MTDKLKITGIEIEIGKKIISLTAEEAMALKRELEQIFGQETAVVPAPYPILNPFYETPSPLPLPLPLSSRFTHYQETI